MTAAPSNPVPPPDDDRSALARALSTRIPLPFSIRNRRRRPLARDLIDSSDLPEPIRALIRRVVRRTRLWRSEQADVARELVAHFADALASAPDPSADQLIAAFGDERTAAKLIRRAKRRNRHWLWHVQRRLGHALGLLLLFLAFLYVRFFLGSPTITRNHLAELNAPILATPESDRAWPLYRQGLLALPIAPPELLTPDPNSQPRKPEDFKPGDPEWPAAIAWFEEAGPAFERFRAAAALPVFGRALSAHGVEPDLHAHLRLIYRGDSPGIDPAAAPPAEPNPSLMSVLLPELAHARAIARLLAADARIAAWKGDGPRAAADLRAMLGLANHFNGSGFLISDLVGVAIAALAQANLSEILERFPQLFDTPALAALAHDISAWGGGRLTVSRAIRSERRFFEDFLQRIYTDDGAGDGRITPSGLNFLGAVGAPDSRFDFESAGGYALAPIVLASRKHQLDFYDSVIAEVHRVADIPPWELSGPDGFDDLDKRLDQGLNRMRYLPVAAILPAYSKVRLSLHTADYTRSATLAVLAAHAFKTDTGAWPDSLDALVPRYLPAVPIDMFDGKPIKYRLIDAGPVIYSIGSNRVDDGGAPTGVGERADRWHSPIAVENARANPAEPSSIPRGDWIFFPPSRAHEPDTRPRASN